MTNLQCRYMSTILPRMALCRLSWKDGDELERWVFHTTATLPTSASPLQQSSSAVHYLVSALVEMESCFERPDSWVTWRTSSRQTCFLLSSPCHQHPWPPFQERRPCDLCIVIAQSKTNGSWILLPVFPHRGWKTAVSGTIGTILWPGTMVGPM